MSAINTRPTSVTSVSSVSSVPQGVMPAARLRSWGGLPSRLEAGVWGLVGVAASAATLLFLA